MILNFVSKWSETPHSACRPAELSGTCSRSGRPQGWPSATVGVVCMVRLQDPFRGSFSAVTPKLGKEYLNLKCAPSYASLSLQIFQKFLISKTFCSLFFRGFSSVSRFSFSFCFAACRRVVWEKRKSQKAGKEQTAFVSFQQINQIQVPAESKNTHFGWLAHPGLNPELPRRPPKR